MSVSLAAIAAIASLAATGISAGMSAKANADARARLAADREEDRKYYSRLLNRDYVNSSENQSLLRRLQEMQRKNYERTRAINTVAGGTDASLAALQAQGNDIVTQTAQGIAARADAYKERVAAAKRASEKAYSQQMFGLDQQKAQTIAQAGGQASKAFAGLAAAGGSAENPFASAGVEQAVVTAAPPVDTTPVDDTSELNQAIQNAYGGTLTPQQEEALKIYLQQNNMFGL